ncbi:MAG: gluconokinase [Siphonobacter sp.]
MQQYCFKQDYPLSTTVLKSDYWIGIDIGTTNTKAVAFDDTGKVQAQHSLSYEMQHPEPDFSEQHPDDIWHAVTGSLQSLAEKLPEATFRSISFSAAMHSIMAVDEQGNPISNLIIWADNRAKAESEKLLKSPTGKKIYKACGTPLHPMAPICKLMWLRKHQPELVARAYKFVGIKEYIWFKLTGEWVIDYSLASATGMFDLRALTWNQVALSTAKIKAEKLSKPVSPYHTFSWKANIILKQEICQLVIGASDGCLANLGTGAVIKGRLAVTIGTSGAVRISSKRPILDEKMRTFCYLLDEETYIIGGGTNSGGVVFQWLCEQFFPDQNEAQLSELAASVPAGSNGLICLPYLLGERAPLWNANAKGCFFGITLRHTAKDFSRAVLESICMHMYSVVKILEEREDIFEIYASGGFAKSPFWVQLLADICGKPVRLPETVEAGAWGAALMALKAEGIIQDHGEKMKGLAIKQSFTPCSEKHQFYEKLYEKFTKLYKLTKNM